MIEILDPLKLDKYINEGLLDDIKKYSLLDDNRIGWNYCFDYIWLETELEKELSKISDNIQNIKIVDIGGGPGAIHGFLEAKYGIDIINVDMARWDEDYVDLVGDFNNHAFRESNNLTNIDFIISTSAFEHNKPSNHAILVKNCLESLSERGRLLTTFAITDKNKIQKFKKSSQWNLTSKIITEIYGEKIENFSNYGEIWKRWHSHQIISREYANRYGKFNSIDPKFLSIGANIPKSNIKNQIIRKTYFLS